MAVIHEAARAGQATKLPEKIVSNCPELEEDGVDFEDQDESQPVSERMRQLMNLNTQVGTGQLKVDKLIMGRKEENVGGDSMVIKPMIFYSNVADVKLPKKRPPKVDPVAHRKKLEDEAKKARVAFNPMDNLSKEVAERAWERRARLDRPGSLPRMMERCDCAYCFDPTPYQTFAYREKDRQRRDEGYESPTSDQERQMRRDRRRAERRKNRPPRARAVGGGKPPHHGPPPGHDGAAGDEEAAFCAPVGEGSGGGAPAHASAGAAGSNGPRPPRAPRRRPAAQQQLRSSQGSAGSIVGDKPPRRRPSSGSVSSNSTGGATGPEGSAGQSLPPHLSGSAALDELLPPHLANIGSVPPHLAAQESSSTAAASGPKERRPPARNHSHQPASQGERRAPPQRNNSSAGPPGGRAPPKRTGSGQLQKATTSGDGTTVPPHLRPGAATPVKNQPATTASTVSTPKMTTKTNSQSGGQLPITGNDSKPRRPPPGKRPVGGASAAAAGKKNRPPPGRRPVGGGPSASRLEQPPHKQAATQSSAPAATSYAESPAEALKRKKRMFGLFQKK